MIGRGYLVWCAAAAFAALRPAYAEVNQVSLSLQFGLGRPGGRARYPASRTATKMNAAPRQVSAMRPSVIPGRFCECASGRMSEAPI